MADRQLPVFDDPPVIETVLSTRFRPVNGLGLAKIVQFWDRHLSGELKDVEERPPYEVPYERFGDDSQPPPFTLQVGTGYLPARLWFSARNDLVQLQPDWFAYNWRQTSPTDEYTRYARSRERFEHWLGLLVREIESMGERFVPVQCEVTYVNHISLRQDDLDVGPFGGILRNVTPQRGDFLPAPELAQYAASYVIEAETAPKAGRLHVRAQQAVRTTDKQPIVVLNATARGNALGEGIPGVLEFCDLGHEWVVRGFEDVTSSVMHERWGIREEEK